MIENIEIRQLVSEEKLTYRAIAKRIGVTPEYLSRCMRYPLKPAMYLRIVKVLHDRRGEQDDAV